MWPESARHEDADSVLLRACGVTKSSDTKGRLMTETKDVQRYADAIMIMIKEDQDSGQVPHDVCSWDELDDSVDTNDYLRRALMPWGTPEAASLHTAVSNEIGRRLAESQGGPWGVTWTGPGGQSLGIGRTMGYATRAEAEAVGRGYLAEHGGSYQLVVSGDA